jgi:hypothetical protein
MGDQKFIISISSVLRNARYAVGPGCILQSLAPTNQHWARVVGYGPFSLYVIHKEGPCSGDINLSTATDVYISHIYYNSDVIQNRRT